MVQRLSNATTSRPALYQVLQKNKTRWAKYKCLDEWFSEKENEAMVQIIIGSEDQTETK